MSVGSVGGERCTFGNVRDTDFELTDLPAIAARKEIDMADFVEVTLYSFANNLLVTMADDATAAATKLTAKENVIKVLAGSSISLPVSGNKGKMYVAAETGGPHTDDLQIVKVRGT